MAFYVHIFNYFYKFSLLFYLSEVQRLDLLSIQLVLIILCHIGLNSSAAFKTFPRAHQSLLRSGCSNHIRTLFVKTFLLQWNACFASGVHLLSSVIILRKYQSCFIYCIFWLPVQMLHFFLSLLRSLTIITFVFFKFTDLLHFFSVHRITFIRPFQQLA